MKTPLLTGSVLLILCLCFTQAGGQNILILEKANKKRHIKYSSSDRISLETRGVMNTFSGRITKITDSSLIINHQFEVLLNNISAVRRKPWGFDLLRNIGLIGGIGYLSLSSLNRAINNENPVVSEESLVIGGSMLAFGILMTPLARRTHSVEDGKWKLIILDFTD